MTRKEKVELGKLLDKHRIKSIYYTEILSGNTLRGTYFLIYPNANEELIEDTIYGIDLE